MYLKFQANENDQSGVYVIVSSIILDLVSKMLPDPIALFSLSF